MHVIVIASQKGGTGKTTLCTSLAVAAANGLANRVAVVDADDQASLSDWIRDRTKNRDAPPGSVRQLPLASFVSIEDGLEAARRSGIVWLFVDTEPSTKSAARMYIALADLVVVPVRPSLPDIRSAGVTLGICEELGKPALAVLTMAKPRSVALREFTRRLRGRVRCADSVQYDRQAYPLAFALGLGVTEGDPQGTGIHVRSLLAEIRAHLDERGREPIEGRAA